MKNPRVPNSGVKSHTKRNQSQPPITIGSGLIALDWLLIGKKRITPNEVYAGGSCGNVMAILSYLGWQSYPVARLGIDDESTRLIKDLKRWKVHTDFMLREQHGVTPVIIVRFRKNKLGKVSRHFEWRHPSSGAWLPRYRPVPQKTVSKILSQNLPVAKVFYFDRAEKSILILAKHMREQGSIVFFEPSSTKNTELFSDCLAVSDIVKYSAERLPKPPKNPISHSPRLEIQTLGDVGLRYRLKTSSTAPGNWQRLPAYPVLKLSDATGCGDWCSAGLISKLCQDGREKFFKLNEADVAKGLRFGQALAAINCEYLGARGPMYHLSASEIVKNVKQLIRKFSLGN